MKASTFSFILLACATVTEAFQISSTHIKPTFGATAKSSFNLKQSNIRALKLSNSEEQENTSSGVMELIDEDEEKEPVAAASAVPFLSQGEISEEALNPDLSDPKQARVIIYIILSLIPVLFLIPLILGSRDFIPMDALPPVEM